MRDFTAGHISTEEATAAAGHGPGTSGQRAAGVCRRASAIATCCFIAAPGKPAPFTRDTRATPPHDLTDKSVLDDYPRGPGSDLLNQLMSDSVALFADHPVNVAAAQGRQAAGHEHLAVGAGTHARPAAVRRSVWQARAR